VEGVERPEAVVEAETPSTTPGEAVTAEVERRKT